jgi:VWFA-related protein
MARFRFFITATMFCIVLLFFNLHVSIGQDGSTIPESETVSESGPVEPLAIKLSVNEVRLDVVVLDNKGNPVTNLTAADFEIFQNGRRQKTLSSVYIKDQSEVATLAVQSPASKKDTRNIPALPATALKREDTRRTIVFVLDDRSMSSENAAHAKMALGNFVEKQMQTGDIVAILQTGQGSSALQMFLSDKNQLLARIKAMRLTGAPAEAAPDDSHLYRIYDNQLSTLSYSIRALKDMPGRKILIMMTAEPALSQPPVRILDERQTTLERISFPEIYGRRFGALADDALRAGVVVNFMNIEGLQPPAVVRDQSPFVLEDPSAASPFSTPGPRFATNSSDAERLFTGQTTASSRRVEEAAQDMYNPPNARNAVNPLPAKTGGITIENSNFFIDGIGKDVDSLMKGYYLISYEPPADTFNQNDKEIFQQVKVNVRRINTQVYTRDGFYNRTEVDTDSAAQPAHPLQNAIFSPFLHTDLDVNIAAGYSRDAKAGYLVRSWIHLDPKDVRIIETEGGGARINVEAVCLTSDISGNVHDLVDTKYTFDINPEKKAENLAWIQKHGIRFAMLLPVKRPGSYYVRIAVRDAESGKIGSAYQYVDITDLANKRPALSSMFMITSADDLGWLRSNAAKETASGVFSLMFQEDGVRSPALRTYTPGNSFQTLLTLYNADVNAIARSEIQIQTVLYKDGREFHRGNPEPIAPDDVDSSGDSVPILRSFTLSPDMPLGDYVLQMLVLDKRNSGKNETVASEALNFTVVER